MMAMSWANGLWIDPLLHGNKNNHSERSFVFMYMEVLEVVVSLEFTPTNNAGTGVTGQVTSVEGNHDEHVWGL